MIVKDSCITCGIPSRSDAEFLHCWQHNQCRKCHYFGIIPKGKMSIKWESNPPHSKVEYHKSLITEKNIELYCKLSQIIRDKPCKNKNLVLRLQHKNKESLP